MNAQPRAYYNDVDREAVAVLKELVASGVIAPGDVDGRSIKEVTADDIRGYTQCHFFAGAGLWSVGARLAGWPDGRSLWSASCPCQPISAAGKQLGADDPRHLWPDLYRLIRAARAAGQSIPVLVGEQVAGSLGYHWFDGVRTDLAREEIAARTIDIPACSVDAPHERNRLWWCAVADTESERSGRDESQRGSEGRTVDGRLDASGAVAQPDSGREARWRVSRPGEGAGENRQRAHDQSGRSDGGALSRRRRWRIVRRGDRTGTLGDGIGTGLEGQRRHGDDWAGWPHADRSAAQADGRNGTFWSDADWIICHDDKARRAKSGIRLLVDGMAGRIGLWRLAGNSVVPQLAAQVLASILDAEADMTMAERG